MKKEAAPRTKSKLPARFRLFSALACIFLILAIVVTTVGGSFSALLSVAMEGSQVDMEMAEQTYSAGIQMNIELEKEGMVLLKNENNTLPLEGGNINLFGDKAVHTVFNASGSAAGNADDAMTLAEGMEKAGFSVNQELLALLDSVQSTADSGVHEGNAVDLSKYPIDELPLDAYTGNCSFSSLKAYSNEAVVVM